MACAMVPLDEMEVMVPISPQGKERTLPALHPDRKEERLFVPYRPPPVAGDPAAVEEFLEHGRFIAEDLEWLLSLPHDRFWCQVVFDLSLQRCLDSYLRHAPRGLEPWARPSSLAVGDLQRLIHRHVFMTFLRMATHKESKDCFITPAVFGEIIYENFLFDIPKMLDLCVLFGKGNSRLLHKMIENIFTQQPGYYSDLNEAVPSVLQVLDTILAQCGLQCEGASALEPLKLRDHGPPTTMTMTQQALADLVLYLCDTCSTLHAFLDVFPSACSTFQSHGFLSRLASFYEAAVPDLEKALRKRNFEDKSLQEDLWRRLSHSSRRMVDTAHLLLINTCLQPILEGVENMQTHAEELLQHLTSFLTEKRFLSDYDEQFPVADDISVLQQALPVVDDTRTSYLLQGVAVARDGVGRRGPQVQARVWGTEAGAGRRDPGEGAQSPGGEEAVEPPLKGDNGAACSLSSGELESLLSLIKDLLPELGDGFLLACLRHYGYSSERVINHILEETLDPSLDSLDRSLPRAMKEEPPVVLEERSNVFDDDEFDVFHRDQLDMSRVWKGRRKGESARDMMNDKRHIADQRARYHAYETVVDEVIVLPGQSAADCGLDDYDDDYDDTYDVNQVGANDLDGDSLLSRRPFTVPQILRPVGRVAQDEEEEEEEEEQQQGGSFKRDQFVQDPALLRERAEARRAAMHHRRGGCRPEGPAPGGGVVGRPKGQGQTADTFLDRRKKEANKSRGANHNRRSMADRKRNKGMIPS